MIFDFGSGCTPSIFAVRLLVLEVVEMLIDARMDTQHTEELARYFGFEGKADEFEVG